MAAHRSTDAPASDATPAKAETTKADTANDPPPKKRRSLFHIPFTGHKAEVTGSDPDPDPVPVTPK
jgi:hypothetical protein